MKTKEFIEKVEALGYLTDADSVGVIVKLENIGGHILFVGFEEDFEIDTDYVDFRKLSRVAKKELMSIVYEYMLTDQADREEEKRYYLRLVTPPILKKQVAEYLRKSEYLEYYTTGLSKDTGDEKIKTIFTESEISQMDITGFEPEEVEG